LELKILISTALVYTAVQTQGKNRLIKLHALRHRRRFLEVSW